MKHKGFEHPWILASWASWASPPRMPACHTPLPCSGHVITFLHWCDLNPVSCSFLESLFPCFPFHHLDFCACRLFRSGISGVCPSPPLRVSSALPGQLLSTPGVLPHHFCSRMPDDSFLKEPPVQSQPCPLWLSIPPSA